jgi:hypothetical protein
MLRIPAVVTAASFLLTVGAIRPAAAGANTTGGANVDQKTSVVVVVKFECKDQCPTPKR